MELKIKINILSAAIFIFLTVSTTSFAAWTESMQIIQGKWGSEYGKFGISYQDTSDLIPENIYISMDGGIIVEDIPNGRTKIFTNEVLVKDFKCVRVQSGGWNEECRISGTYVGNNNNGDIITDLDGMYKVFNNSGLLLASYNEKPKLLGLEIDSNEQQDGSYSQTIEYNDIIFHVVSSSGLHKYFRDNAGYLYGIGKVKSLGGYPWRYRVYKYDKCGKNLGYIDLPENKIIDESSDSASSIDSYVTVEEEYGEPIIGPNGNIYCWKRTPTTYSILKWTWVDSPDDPKGGPDVPLDLKVVPSTTGLSLAWAASPQDPGCVEGYEVERSSTSSGIFSNLTTTAAGVVKYNDTGALSGSTLYYRIRAKSSCGPSPYTAEISGKRP